MAEDKLFQITRHKLLQKYHDAKQNYQAGTRPYRSTVQCKFDVLDPLPSEGRPVMAHLVSKVPQELLFFQYGIGESIPWADVQRRATDGDTNQSKGGQTIGVEDFVIEGISATAKGIRIQYFQATASNPSLGKLNPLVKQMYQGQAYVMDPGSLVTPPQVQSPVNLEDTLFESLKPHMALSFTWDRTRTDPIGTMDQVPEGGAKSYLRASGEPSGHNYFRVPEGYIWRREGEPDSQLVVRATLTEPVVIPISLVSLPLPPDGEEPTRLPMAVYVDITMRLHGLYVSIPSKN